MRRWRKRGKKQKEEEAVENEKEGEEVVGEEEEEGRVRRRKETRKEDEEKEEGKMRKRTHQAAEGETRGWFTFRPSKSLKSNFFNGLERTARNKDYAHTSSRSLGPEHTACFLPVWAKWQLMILSS